MARPTKLNDAIAEALEKSLAVGNTPKVAAPLAGINERTYYNWIERGQADAEAGKATPFARFASRMATALAQAEQALVVVPLARAAKQGDLRAAQFLATHRFGWSSTTKTELTGKDGQALAGPSLIVIQPPEMTTDDGDPNGNGG